ncbi:hypothetical protein SAMN05421810_105316 [Amycolatopsis arida]|uniref:Uncharacterized protein n=1 Tax=Amycolatopsis arida TaxID=587909 RepID=A0A1I5WWT5_9PSEU|nr:hypothetical protein [Amycolatopsis arida]TDX92490.1 hypothetical protein CLV69_105335 [Amycolatopsis arida]SFQ24144.1 hypothetical protein SAMN05421810_105316 [Amycolatopsis arida]
MTRRRPRVLLVEWGGRCPEALALARAAGRAAPPADLPVFTAGGPPRPGLAHLSGATVVTRWVSGGPTHIGATEAGRQR